VVQAEADCSGVHLATSVASQQESEKRRGKAHCVPLPKAVRLDLPIALPLGRSLGGALPPLVLPEADEPPADL
jgi:hypothetical protein